MRNKCLGAFLVFITIPLVALSILLVSSFSFFRVEMYKELLTSSNAYEKIVLLIPRDNADDDLLNSIYKSVDAKWLKTNFEKNADLLFAFLNGKTNSFDFDVDISALKTDLHVAMPELKNLNLPDTLSVQSYQNVLNQLGKTLSDNKMDLQEITNQLQNAEKFQAEFENNLKTTQTSIKFYKIGTYIVIGLTLILLCLIGIVSRYYPPAILRFVGLTLLIPSGLLAIFTMLTKNLLVNWYNPLTKIELSEPVRALINPIFNKLVANTTNQIIVISLVIAMIGILMTIGSFIWASLRPQATPVQTRPEV